MTDFLTAKIWLGYSLGKDNTKQVHSLVYSLDDKKVQYVDLGGFRPSPESELVVDKKYDCMLNFSEEYGYNGQDIKVLRKVIVKGGSKPLVFVHIR